MVALLPIVAASIVLGVCVFCQLVLLREPLLLLSAVPLAVAVGFALAPARPGAPERPS